MLFQIFPFVYGKNFLKLLCIKIRVKIWILTHVCLGVDMGSAGEWREKGHTPEKSVSWGGGAHLSLLLRRRRHKR